jgi:hypothetical protein
MKKECHLQGGILFYTGAAMLINTTTASPPGFERTLVLQPYVIAEYDQLKDGCVAIFI